LTDGKCASTSVWSTCTPPPMCGHQWNDLFSRHGNHCSWEMWWKVGSWFHNIHWDSMLPATSEVQVYPHISLSTEPPDESIIRSVRNFSRQFTAA
jgi:hypothetical protein